MEQSALDAGKLIMWNKGFNASGVVGEDVVSLLQTQLAARGIELQVTALAIALTLALALTRPLTVTRTRA